MTSFNIESLYNTTNLARVISAYSSTSLKVGALLTALVIHWAINLISGQIHRSHTMFSLNRVSARPGIRSIARTPFRHPYISTPACKNRWPKGVATCPSWILDNNKKGVATNLRMDLPYISHAFQRTLACSLYYLRKQNSVKSFLWGDLLHGLLTGYSPLPHVSSGDSYPLPFH